MGEREDSGRARAGPGRARLVAVLVGAALLLALALTRVLTRPAHSSSRPEAPRALAGDAPALAPLGEAPRGPGRTELADARPAGAAQDPGAPPARPRAERARLEIRGRVVDARGEPLAGADVLATALEGEDSPAELLALSRADGTFSGVWPRAGWLEVEVFAARHARAVLRVNARAEALELGTLVLLPGEEVAGQVMDERGQPQAGASVTAVAAEATLAEDVPWSRDVPLTRTAADGRFRLRGVALGPRRVVAEARGAVGQSEPFELRAGGAPELRIVVPRADESGWIGGVVRAPDGTPLAGIAVTMEGVEQFSLEHSGADGSFLFALEMEGPMDLFASDPAQRFGATERRAVAPGARDVELRLATPEWLELRLVDPGGRPIAWGNAWNERAWKQEPLPPLALGERGRARIPRPRRPLALEAAAPGFRRTSFGPFEPAELGPELVLTLAPGQCVRGRVTSAGRPVAGAALDLAPTLAPGAHGEARGVAPEEWPFALAGAVELGARDGETERDGGFLLSVPGDGWHGLRVDAPGFPTTVFGPFALSLDGANAELALELEPAGAIAGRVRVPPGESALGRLVGATNGWGFVRTAPVAADGSYRLDALAPGAYQVRPCAPPVGAVQALEEHWSRLPVSEPILWDCAVRAGAVTAFDLDLSAPHGCVVEGRFRFGRADPRQWSASLGVPAKDGAMSVADAPLGADGHFRLAVARAGTYELSVATEGDGWYETLRLDEGVTAWSVEREAASLRLLPPAGGLRRGSVGLVMEASGAPSFAAFRECRWLPAEGEVVRVPTGRLRVELHEGMERIGVLAELDVRADGETVFTLPADSR